jgi:Protein of unknown function (DUF3999)
VNCKLIFAMVIAGIGVAAPAAVATSTSDDYAYAWPLQVSGDSAAWQVALTPEVYAVITRADLGDVEVINADGESVAFALHRLPTTTSTSDAPRPLTLFSLPARTNSKSTDNETISLHVRRDGDGKLRSIDAQVAAPKDVTGGAVPRGNGTSIDAIRGRALLADASALKLPLATVLVDWDQSADNVTAQFAIDASDDLQQWHGVAANASVLRLAQGDHVLERHDIALGGVRAAYLRLRRLDDGPPLRGLRVSVRPLSVSTPAQSALEWVAAAADGSEALATTRNTDRQGAGVAYRYRLPAPLAIEALRVRFADDNTLAALTLFSSQPGHSAAPYTDATAWSLRGRYVAFRLRQGDTLLENDDFSFAPGERVRDLRLDTPLALSHPLLVSVAYRPDRFVFLAQGRGPFRLVAGSARRTRAAYPVAAALAPLRAKFGEDWQPPLATLGPRQTLQGDRALVASPPEPVPHDWRTWLLWAVLVGAAALIGGLALKLLRNPVKAE